ncbi:MAG: HK97 gp10 family phage protein [Pseudomonadota bacterium]
MIKGTVIGSEQVIARLKVFPTSLREELRTAVTRSAFNLQRHVKENKLSGQVLKVRTGRLRRSINVRVTDSESQVVGSVGTNVEYARAHEFGFKGVVNVREHLRRTVSGFRASVRAHSRKVNLPERSFLRDALKDKRLEIRREFDLAVKRAIPGSMTTDGTWEGTT